VGTTEGDNAEIVQGLTPGDLIATDNFDKLQDGMRISPHKTVAEATVGNPR